jgi:rhodanese-related sulfurtransferase
VNYGFYASDFAQKIAKLDKNRPVMVYCAAGGRSASAASQFKKLGFAKVYDLDGGMGAWKKAGKKTVR